MFAQKFENLVLTPPMGWNSWNKYGCEIDEQIIKDMCHGMVISGLRDVGYEYIIIDDCWAVDRDKNGNIIVDPKKFPSGIKSLAEYVHSQGLKLGIYSCAGDKTCNKRPGSRGHEYQDARTYAAWGIDYLKYDWCYHGKLNAEASFLTMRDALYAAGRPIVFSICEWGDNKPWKWGNKIGNLWRTTWDIRPCSNCVTKTGQGLGWINILEKQVPITSYSGPGGWNDPDMLEVGNGNMTYNEEKAHFTMWCMLSAPLILGNDLLDMSDETLNILSDEDLINIDQDPLGKSAFRYVTIDGIDVWVKELKGDRYAIAFLNKKDDPNELFFDWKWRRKCFFSPHGDYEEYSIYNVWEKRNMGTTETPLKYKFKERDILLMILEKK